MSRMIHGTMGPAGGPSEPQAGASERADRARRAMSGIGRAVALVGSAAIAGGAGAGALRAASSLVGAAGGPADGDALTRAREMNAESQLFQMEYLEIQQQVQDDNRRFSLLTNIMRSHHETTKAAIQNIRS